MRRFLLGIVVGAVLVLGAQVALPAPRIGGPLEAAPSPTPAPTVPPAVQQQLDTVQRALTQARQSGKAVPVTITLTEQQLSATAAAHFPLTYGATLTDPAVRLRPGQIELDCAATVAILRTTATVLAIPLVSGGRPAARIDSATIGGQNLPDAARDLLAAEIANAIAAGVPANLFVSSIVVGQGTMTVQATANP